MLQEKSTQQIQNLDKIIKARHYQQFFEVSKTNLHRTREGRREVLNNTKKNPQKNDAILINTRTISDPIELPKRFNKHFCNIIKEVVSKISLLG